jgi:HSP20 family protein
METKVTKQKQLRPTLFTFGSSQFATAVAHLHFSNQSTIWIPPTDIFETDTRLVVRVEIAGMVEDNFSIKIELNHLIISGVRPEALEPRAFHRMEINYGEFITEVELPEMLDLSHIDAEYKDGFLTVVIQKTQIKHIKVND